MTVVTIGGVTHDCGPGMAWDGMRCVPDGTGGSGSPVPPPPPPAGGGGTQGHTGGGGAPPAPTGGGYTGYGGYPGGTTGGGVSQGFTPPPGYVYDPNSGPGYGYWYYNPNGDPNDPATWVQAPGPPSPGGVGTPSVYRAGSTPPPGYVYDPNSGPGYGYWYYNPNGDPNNPNTWWQAAGPPEGGGTTGGGTTGGGTTGAGSTGYGTATGVPGLTHDTATDTWYYNNRAISGSEANSRILAWNNAARGAGTGTGTGTNTGTGSGYPGLGYPTPTHPTGYGGPGAPPGGGGAGSPDLDAYYRALAAGGPASLAQNAAQFAQDLELRRRQLEQTGALGNRQLDVTAQQNRASQVQNLLSLIIQSTGYVPSYLLPGGLALAGEAATSGIRSGLPPIFPGGNPNSYPALPPVPPPPPPAPPAPSPALGGPPAIGQGPWPTMPGPDIWDWLPGAPMRPFR